MQSEVRLWVDTHHHVAGLAPIGQLHGGGNEPALCVVGSKRDIHGGLRCQFIDDDALIQKPDTSSLVSAKGPLLTLRLAPEIDASGKRDV